MNAVGRREIEELDRLAASYSDLACRLGDAPEATQWRDRATQERRMRILAEVGDLSTAKVLDFGCGTGHLLTVLREGCGFAGEYVGYDLSAEMIRLAAAKFPEARFACRNIFVDGVGEDFDFVLISGVFNNRIGNGADWMGAALSLLFARTRKALAFNALSTYVDGFDPNLAYSSPERVFAFCKETLSPLVTLRHDYCVKAGVVPFEFTVYVHRTEIPVRRNRPPTALGRDSGENSPPAGTERG
jgi:SAM-dependent methyltransferase